jgi:hypothetical protein
LVTAPQTATDLVYRFLGLLASCTFGQPLPCRSSVQVPRGPCLTTLCSDASARLWLCIAWRIAAESFSLPAVSYSEPQPPGHTCEPWRGDSHCRLMATHLSAQANMQLRGLCWTFPHRNRPIVLATTTKGPSLASICNHNSIPETQSLLHNTGGKVRNFGGAGSAICLDGSTGVQL